MRSILITGGAGFIGCNSVKHFAERGWAVTLLDNLSRKGASANVEWLREAVPFRLEVADVRDREAVDRVVRESMPEAVLHLAAQVAVTTSLVDPRTDLEINALGTVNLLESVRAHSPSAVFVYSSTNKVYGRMEDVGVVADGSRYVFRDLPSGVSEERRLDFHSPYGCSKGAADQYTLDYHKSYGLRSVTLRQSCIYGTRQFGVEDQGWVAWFVIAALLGRPITIYGDGKQVRDVLDVRDLVALYELVIANPDRIAGEAFNIGGGPQNALSLLDLLSQLETVLGHGIPRSFSDWRRADQPVYVSDIEKVRRVLGWEPRVSATEGVASLIEWVGKNRTLF